jgi:hypothetical protein
MNQSIDYQSINVDHYCTAPLNVVGGCWLSAVDCSPEKEADSDSL